MKKGKHALRQPFLEERANAQEAAPCEIIVHSFVKTTEAKESRYMDTRACSKRPNLKHGQSARGLRAGTKYNRYYILGGSALGHWKLSK